MAPPVPGSPVRRPVSRAAPNQDHPRCTGISGPTRITLQPGRATSYGATSIAPIGESEDLLADGTSAWTYAFDLTADGKTESWRPDSGDTARFQLVAGLCVRLVNAMTLDVADVPRTMRHCAISCCRTAASQKPAPGGEIECCFCKE